MSNTESGVRLRRRGTSALGFYKFALALSLIANVLFAVGLWNETLIVTAVEKIRTAVAFLN